MRVSTINREFEKLMTDLKTNGYGDAYYFVAVAHKSFSDAVLSQLINENK